MGRGHTQAELSLFSHIQCILKNSAVAMCVPGRVVLFLTCSLTGDLDHR